MQICGNEKRKNDLLRVNFIFEHCHGADDRNKVKKACFRLSSEWTNL